MLRGRKTRPLDSSMSLVRIFVITLLLARVRGTASL